MPVTVVDDGACVALPGPEEGGRDIKGVVKRFAVADIEEGAIETDQSPFVEVGAERVGISIDVVEAQGGALLGQGESDTGPCRIDV